MFMSISFIIQFKVKNDKRAAFFDIMSNVKSKLPEVKGCLGVLIHGVEDQSNYTMVETWQSKEFHEKHVEGLVSTGVWDSIVEHLSEDPKSGYYTVL